MRLKNRKVNGVLNKGGGVVCCCVSVRKGREKGRRRIVASSPT